MDFRVVDSLVCSNSASNNGGSLASETDADVNNLRLYGSAFLNREAEDDLPPAKMAKINSSCGGGMTKVSLQECNGGGLNQQMLSFSAHHAPPVAFPFVRNSSGYGCTSIHGVRGPFTTSQWMELEHQALIYKYITANVPIPSYLLNPIRKALEYSGFSCFSLLRPNALGWGGFDSKSDPEPGRCRRTDGKKWRCSREAVTDQKYCERHINRGRHRSRKPVEGGATNNQHTSANKCLTDKETPKMCLKDNQHNNAAVAKSSEFGSDSLLNPSNRHAHRRFIDEYNSDRTELSMGLGGGGAVATERHNISWEGGPLGEALHTTTATGNSAAQCKALLGVLGGAYAG